MYTSFYGVLPSTIIEQHSNFDRFQILLFDLSSIKYPTHIIYRVIEHCALCHPLSSGPCDRALRSLPPIIIGAVRSSIALSTTHYHWGRVIEHCALCHPLSLGLCDRALHSLPPIIIGAVRSSIALSATHHCFRSKFKQPRIISGPN